MRKHLTMLCICTFALASAWAQTQITAKNYALQTWQGNINVQPNVGDFVAHKNNFRAFLFDKKYYVVVQFADILLDYQQENLQKNGFELLNYLPNYAYFAAINTDADTRLLTEYNARAVVGLGSKYKLDGLLTAAALPEWAMIDNGDIEVVFTAYKGIDTKKTAAALRTAGYTPNAQQPLPYGVVLRIMPSALEQLAALPYCAYIAPTAAPAHPEDREGRSMQRANAIDALYPMGRHYNGDGVGVALADDGFVGAHIDFKGRITQYTTTTGGTHGDGVAGLVGGAGNLNPDNQGMATRSSLLVYDISNYPHIISAPTNLASGTPITTTSYSQGSGGVYDATANDIDAQIIQYPQLLHCFSAGNAGSGYSTITGGRKAAKNVFAVGNLNENDLVETSSSRGPAQDGRVKPDICAHGQGQTSTTENNAYQVFGGTSAASPTCAGTVAQLYQAYKTLNNNALPESALIKAVMLNTAQDLGNANVDYTYGYGRINALRAVETLEQNRYVANVATPTTTDTFIINVPANTRQLKVMTHWADKPGAANANPSIVNNLNTTLTTPAGITTNPWILTPTSPASAATMGIDNLNNTEQITLTAPTEGIYTLLVTGASVPQSPQKYYVTWDFVPDNALTITYPIGGEAFTPATTEIVRWDASTNTGAFALEYSANSGTSWTPISTTIPANVRHYSWNVPSISSGFVKMRITRSGISDQSDENFSITNMPTNLQLTKVCPDSTRIQWVATPNASQYVVYKLGNKFMDSVATVTTNNYTFVGLNPYAEDWFAISAQTANGGRSKRTNALRKPIGLLNCIQNIDANLSQTISPANGIFTNCNATPSIPVSIKIQNTGAQAITNLVATYKLNNNATITENITTTIAANAFYTHNFATNITPIAGNMQVILGVMVTGDSNGFNNADTINFVMGTVQPQPYLQTLNAISTFAAANIEIQNPDTDITWEIMGSIINANGNLGKAARMNFFDYNAAGQTDDLLLPVIDLTTAIHPVFYFDVAYRQYTGSSDALKIEISTDCGTTYTPSTYNKSGATLATVTPPVTTKFSPTLASQWRKDTLDLTPYIGNKIRLKMVGMCGYGNDLFIDNFEIKEYISGNTPVANFTISPNNCIGGTTTFTDASPTTGITAWSWNFGTGATPTTASTQGPHTITYNTGGNKTSTLTISTAAGSVNTSQTIVVNAPTTASFNYTTPAPTTLTFNNTSTNANSYLWQFGNGGTSTQANPTYTYTTNGTYTIVLRTQNNCNTSADTTIVQIPIVSTNDLQGWAAKVYPNPANDQVTIQIPNLQETIATISITDLIGKNLYIHTTADPSGSTNINTEKLTSGPYIIEIKMADKVYRTKLNILK